MCSVVSCFRVLSSLVLFCFVLSCAVFLYPSWLMLPVLPFIVFSCLPCLIFSCPCLVFYCLIFLCVGDRFKVRVVSCLVLPSLAFTCLVLCYHMLSWLMLPILSYIVLSCPALPCLILSCPCLVFFCLILFCLRVRAVSCLVLSWPALSLSSLVLFCTVTQAFKLTPSSARKKERLTLTLTLTLSLSPNPDLKSGPNLTPTANAHLGRPTEMSLNLRNVILGFLTFCCCLVLALPVVLSPISYHLSIVSCLSSLAYCFVPIVSFFLFFVSRLVSCFVLYCSSLSCLVFSYRILVFAYFALPCPPSLSCLALSFFKHDHCNLVSFWDVSFLEMSDSHEASR